MTVRTDFEAMLESLVNEDQQTAREIFHKIVVEKAREIYENLLAEDFSLEDEEEDSDIDLDTDEEEDDDFSFDDEDAEENTDFDDEDDQEDFDFDDEDESDDMEESDIEDRVYDIEDDLKDLRAEFEQLMVGERNEPEHQNMNFDDEEDIDADDSFEDEGEDDDSFEDEDDDFDEKMFEYVNKVTLPKHGDNGVQVKSPVASKNDMGGTVANIVKGGVSSKSGTQGGLVKPSTQRMDAGNVNVPGSSKASKLSPVSKPSNKGADSTNKRSIVGSRGKR